MTSSFHDYLKPALWQQSAAKTLLDSQVSAAEVLLSPQRNSMGQALLESRVSAAEMLIDHPHLMHEALLEHLEDPLGPSDILPDTFPDAAL